MNFIKKTLDTIRGNKTYVAAVTTIVTAGLGYYNHELTQSAAVNMVVLAILAATLRSGISTESDKAVASAQDAARVAEEAKQQLSHVSTQVAEVKQQVS